MGQIKNIKLHIVTDIKPSNNTNKQLRHSSQVKGRGRMKMIGCVALLALVQSLLVLVAGETCTSPSVSTDTYTSKHVQLSSETAYVAEFTLNCKEEDVKGINLYAEIESGVLVPVANVPDTNSYQVSWSKDHKQAVTGTIAVKMYDDDGYTAYRKAQRTEGGDVAAVAPLFVVNIEHPGVSKEGLFVQTEFIAVVAALLVWWAANSMKSQIME